MGALNSFLPDISIRIFLSARELMYLAYLLFPAAHPPTVYFARLPTVLRPPIW